MVKLDINVDMGESFGRYALGTDEEVMKYITSANIATCFHAGDPVVLERTIKWAKQYNVAVGAHLGLDDKQGFGRRAMDITPEELRTDTIYQLGAMDGFLKVHGMKMQHVKPHGILYRMVYEYEKYMEVFLQTIKDYNPELIVVCTPVSPAFELGKKMGLKMAGEALIDLSYDDEGKWVMERNKKPRDGEEVARRAVTVAKEKKIDAMSGKMIDVDAITCCIHGDSPNAVEEAATVRAAMLDNGIQPANMIEILG